MADAVNEDKSGTYVGVGKGGVNVNTKGRKPPVFVHGPFLYNYAATETQIHDDPNVALFFLEKDIRPGAAMTLLLTKTTPGASFLPRSEADAIPFSSAKLPEILARFAIKAGSPEADAIRTTLQECEEPAVRGERKYCATSLESMVEFATSSLGTPRVASASTEVSKPGTPKQSYTIKGAKAMAGERLVACHAEAYTYAVFFCHATAAARAYTVELAGADGTEVKAVAVCHTDTRAWNPGHVAFKVLGVKPGTVPVCHFLPEDHVVWYRSSQSGGGAYGLSDPWPLVSYMEVMRVMG